MSFGIIAGSGPFPLQLARSLKQRGESVVVAAHLDETLPGVAEYADETEWIHLGQLGRVAELFERHRVTRATMAGPISRHRIVERLKPDALGMQLLQTIDFSGDDTVLRAIARLFESRGVAIVDAADFLPELRLPAGHVAGPPLNKSLKKAVELGIRVLNHLGEVDLGQSVVVREGSIWAIESAEGTDRTIRRGTELGGPGCVVVKLAKPGQDIRFDAPTIGPRTIDVMSESPAACLLAFDAERGLVFDAPELAHRATEKGITVYGLSLKEINSCDLSPATSA